MTTDTVVTDTRPADTGQGLLLLVLIAVVLGVAGMFLMVA
jgi:hypothetical protein